MATFVVRRLAVAAPVFLAITILVFGFIALAPGDAASAYTTPEQRANPVAIQQARERLGLDQPIAIRYVRWVASALQGDLGYRTAGGRPIVSEVFGRLPASLLLTGTAIALGLLIGVPLGVLSATRQYSRLDYLLTGVTFLGISFPAFLLGLGGLYLFGLQMKIVPIGGLRTPGSEFELFDVLRHMALPVLILTFGYGATFMRYTRSAMLEVINSDYITTARAKGLPPRLVMGRHALRNALIPIITILALAVPDIVGAAVVVEAVFGWPGVGLLMVEGVSQRDHFLIMGVAIVLASTVLLANIVADVAYAFADPRIRYG